METTVPCCHVNYFETSEVIQHFRDLINVGHLLVWDVEEERAEFVKKLKEVGWDDNHVVNFQNWALNTSIWEEVIPKNIREVGDWRIAKRLKADY